MIYLARLLIGMIILYLLWCFIPAMTTIYWLVKDYVPLIVVAYILGTIVLRKAFVR